MPLGNGISRANGVTPSERYLKQLCDRSFLSLWSYPGIYRDQGLVDGKGIGKELCDLLVVFDNHVIIFSDKNCRVSNSGDPHLDWCRWYRPAIEKSAKQVWGAERWMRKFPRRLFLDPECTQLFPLDIPDFRDAKIHRIVVAHGASQRCQQLRGGRGGLAIDPKIIGPMHLASPKNGGNPFAVGQIDPKKGFIHVLDDASLDLVMGELDTISDFVGYLSDKEKLIASGMLDWAASEEDLLAHYLFPVAGKGPSTFVLPTTGGRLTVGVGVWDDYERDKYRLSRNRANQISYVWDGLIASFSEPIIEGTEKFATNPGVKGGVTTLRFLAKESRTRRRMLGQSLYDMIRSAPAGPNMRSTRVKPATRSGEPYYLFLLLSPDIDGASEEQYREFRRLLLEAHCAAVAIRFPDALHVVGIATEPGAQAYRSQDIAYLEAGALTNRERLEAKRIADELGLLTHVKRSAGEYYDFPHPAAPPESMAFLSAPQSQKGKDRNRPCYCGSGRKFKHCCGRLD